MQRSQLKYDSHDEWIKNRDKGLCPVCAKTKDEFEPRRQVYCSQKCANKYQSKIITWSELRDRILKRDGEVCNECNTTPKKQQKKFEKEFKKLVDIWKKSGGLKDLKVMVLKEIAELECLLNDEKKLIEKKGHYTRDFPSEWDLKNKIISNFQVDHIIAIVNGGDQWDEKNLQVLCGKCHHKKTTKDIRKRVKGNKTLTPNEIQEEINKK